LTDSVAVQENPSDSFTPRRRYERLNVTGRGMEFPAALSRPRIGQSSLTQMRINLTERPNQTAPDLRSAAELAPSLALPWIVRLRYGVLIGQTALILAARYLFEIKLPIEWLTLPLATVAVSNLLFRRASETLGVRRSLGSFLALDTVCLTALLALSGGPANPFSLLYLVQITLSAVVLSREWTWGLGILSMACFGFLFPLHVRVSIFEGHHTGEGFSVHLIGMWIAFATGTLLITVLIGKISEALRKREQEVLSLQHQLARHERLASIVTLSAGAAHELGSPLATIAIAAKDLEVAASTSENGGAVYSDARLIRAEVERCSQILLQMSARGAEPHGEAPSPVDLGQFVKTVHKGFAAQAQRQIQVTTSGKSGPVLLPKEATRQALSALIKNALDSSPDGLPVSVSAEATEKCVRFVVIDLGSGMGPEILERIGEPFFTTKAPDNGMGLGTFLVRVFAERLGGDLIFESEPGKGTRATLELPQGPI